MPSGEGRCYEGTQLTERPCTALQRQHKAAFKDADIKAPLVHPDTFLFHT